MLVLSTADMSTSVFTAVQAVALAVLIPGYQLIEVYTTWCGLGTAYHRGCILVYTNGTHLCSALGR